jgi:hypothetical protein
MILMTLNNRYRHLDQQKKKIQEAKSVNPAQSFEESLQDRLNAFGGEDQLAWIYKNDIEKVWKSFVETGKSKDGR